MDYKNKKGLYETEYNKGIALQQVLDIATIDEGVVTTRINKVASDAKAAADSARKSAANDRYKNAQDATLNGKLDVERNAGDITK